MSKLLTQTQIFELIFTDDMTETEYTSNYSKLINRLKELQQNNDINPNIELSVDDSYSILSQKLENETYIKLNRIM